LVTKSFTFTRFHLGHVDFASEKWRASVDEVTTGIADGWLKVHIEEAFPFEKAGDMLARLASRQVSGKLILAVNRS
jgi:NADPH2:quinone reductase